MAPIDAEIAHLRELAGSADAAKQESARELAAELGRRVRSMAKARSLLLALARNNRDAGVAFLDAWCVTRSVADAIELSQFAWNYQLKPTDAVQWATAQRILSNGSVSAEQVLRALRWLMGLHWPGQPDLTTRMRLLSIACDPQASAHRELATDCLLKVEEWDTDMLAALAAYLTELPREHWPRRLLDVPEMAERLAPAWPGVRDRLRWLADSCPLGTEKGCDRDIRRRRTVFVAHPFMPEITAPLRSAVDIAVAAFPGYTAAYADTDRLDGVLLCHICLAIRRAAVTLFDLTSRCMDKASETGFCRRARSNPNVTLELGLAFAYRRPALLFALTGCDLPADIGGHVIQRFNKYSVELPAILTRGIESVLQAQG